MDARDAVAFCLLSTARCATTVPMRPMTPAPSNESIQALREIFDTGGYTQGLSASIVVAPKGDAVLFLRSGPSDRIHRLFSFDVGTGATRELASGESLLGTREEQLTIEEKARRERLRIVATGIATFSLSQDGSAVLLPVSGKIFVLERATGRIHALAGVDGATDPQFSPDARSVSFVRDHDLWIGDWRTGALRAITTGGTEGVSHGEAEFVAQEEMGRSTGYWWSPDSTRIAWEESDIREVGRNYIADPSRPSDAPVSFAYPFAGKANAKVRLAVQSIDAGAKPEWIEWDRARLPYLAAVTWDPGAPLAIVAQSRDQRDVHLFAADPSTGKTRELVHEHDDAWVDLAKDMPWGLEKSGEFLWLSQAGGEWRLSLHDRDGARVRVLNPGNEFRVRRVLHVDEAKRRVIVTGSDDAPRQQVWELSLDGAAPKKLNAGGGTFSRVYPARGGEAFVETRTDLKHVPTADVHRADGTIAGTLPSVAKRPPFFPTTEITKAAAFDATITRPRDFKPGQRYPVIVFVYGGPSEGQVHDAQDNTWLWRSQWYADQGFVVVSSDNRGILNRGSAWEHAIHGDFGGVTLDDQIAALQALGAKHPEMDLARVGMIGWSFGGFMSALSVTKRGDIFKAAVAGAPVVDWIDYDTHYTERYLGTPQDNPSAYEKSSVLTYTKNLSRPLLLFHGTADDNVYFVNSLKLADALFRDGKSFELVPIARATHMAIRLPETAVPIDTRAAAFFREHL